mgnify:CR=1 FL=1
MRAANIYKKTRGEAQIPFVIASIEPNGSRTWYSSVGAEVLAQHVLFLLNVVCAITPTEMGLKAGQSHYAGLHNFFGVLNSFPSVSS